MLIRTLTKDGIIEVPGYSTKVPGLACYRHQDQGIWYCVHLRSGKSIAALPDRKSCYAVAAALADIDWTAPSEVLRTPEILRRILKLQEATLPPCTMPKATGPRHQDYRDEMKRIDRLPLRGEIRYDSFRIFRTFT